MKYKHEDRRIFIEKFYCTVLMSALMLVTAAIFSSAVKGFQSAGSLDPTFGIGGKVTTPIINDNDFATAIAVQPDGKIVTAGYAEGKAGASWAMAFVRYNPDGSLDPEFGNDGKVTIPIAGTHSRAYAVAIQPDGKIVAAGDIGRPMGVVRLKSDGSLDPTFDDDGMVTVEFYNNDLANAVAIQPDGKIVIAGYTEGPLFEKQTKALQFRMEASRLSDLALFHTTDFALARLNTDGSPDITFGNAGKVITGLTMGDIAYALVIQPDGKIVAAGETFDFISDCSALVRYNPNGTLDPSFAIGGTTITCTSNKLPMAATSVALQSDNKLITGGITVDSDGKSGYEFALNRYTVEGLLDNTFGVDGEVVTEISHSDDECLAVAIQPNGKIIAAGFAFDSPKANFALARYESNGSLDITFGSGGVVTTDFAKAGDWATGIAVQSDGKILAAGYASVGDASDFAIARYNGDAAASRHTLFDFDGDLKTDISIFRPAAAEWWYLRSSDDVPRATQFGTETDRVVAADYTGDGKSDVAVFRPGTGEWFVLRSEDGSYFSLRFGIAEDIPMPADYDGDGKADVAVFRPSTGTWFILRSSDLHVSSIHFGAAGDQPVAADYDGDGKADVAVFRANGSHTEWWIDRSTTGLFVTQFGSEMDKAVPGDFTGDGKADVSVWRPSTGEWFILRSENLQYFGFQFGAEGDVAVPGDYDGDGRVDAGIFRPSTSTWYVNRSTNGILITGFGLSTDQAVPNAYVR